MVVQHWSPFAELRQLQDTMNRFLRGDGHPSGEIETWGIPLDVAQEGDNFVIRASLPGVNPDDIKVAIEDNVLTILGQSAAQFEQKDGDYLMRERRTGAFYRALRLPDSVDTNQAHPHYRNGVLTITIPKAEHKKAKELKVSVGGKVLNG